MSNPFLLWIVGCSYRLWLLYALSILLAWMLNVDTYTVDNFYDQKRLIQLAVFFLLMATLFFSGAPSSFLQVLFIDKRLLLFVCLFFAVGFISALSSSHVLISMSDVLLLLLLVSSSVVMAVVLREDGYNLFYYIIFFGFLCILLKFILGLINAVGVGDTLDATLLLTGVKNINFYCQVIGLFLPWLFLAAIYVKELRYKVLFFVCSVCCLLILLVADNRGVLLSILIVSMVFIVIDRPMGMKFLLTLLITIFLASIIYFGILWLTNDLGLMNSQLENIASSSGRKELWLQALLVWIKQPLLGLGPYGFALLPNAHSLSHPHNFLLQVLVEWGLIAFLVLILLLFLIVVKGYKRIKQGVGRGDFFIVCGGLACLEGFLHSMLSGVLVMPASQVFMVVCLAAFLSGETAKDKILFSSNEVPQLYNYFVLPSLFFGLIFYTLIILYVKAGSDDSCLKNIGPRLWVEGGRVPCDLLAESLRSKAL